MARFRVYLAGSMSHATLDSALQWRKYAALELAKYDIASYSPMRGKEFDPSKPIGLDSEKEMGGAENTTRAIMARDFLDCTKADALLVYLDCTTPIPSGGTIAELSFAYMLRIPAIVCVPTDSYYWRHPMINEEITYRVDTIDEGIKVVVSVLLP